jgi:hypothetical protein
VIVALGDEKTLRDARRGGGVIEMDTTTLLDPLGLGLRWAQVRPDLIILGRKE